jgi:hypothetical protein
MPRKIEPELSEEIATRLRSAFSKAGVADIEEFTAEAIANLALRQGELIELIPHLQPKNISEFIAATAAAIAGEAITPDIGRALLYAAQLAIAARGSAPEGHPPRAPRPS